VPAAAAIAVAVVAAGTTGYQAYTASQAKSEAIDEKGKQEKLAEKAANDARANSDKERADIAKVQTDAATTDAANATRIAQQRRRNIPSFGNAKGGTILTGPLGLSEPAITARKTLLGQ